MNDLHKDMELMGIEELKYQVKKYKTLCEMYEMQLKEYADLKIANKKNLETIHILAKKIENK